MRLDESNNFEVQETHNIVYARRGDRELAGDLYAPRFEGPVPVLVAFHGGGWKRGTRSVYQYWGQYLARRGVALFAVSYRLIDPQSGSDRYPAAVADARSAVKFVRANAGRLGVDPERLGVIGDSAGAHLACLVSVAGDRPPFDALDAGEPAPLAETPTRTKVAIGVYGVYDLLAQWQYDLLSRPRDNLTEILMGTSALEDRLIYQQASPLSYVSTRNNSTAYMLAWGTADDIVDHREQSVRFLEALKQTEHFVRTAILTDAPHFWMSDPIDEPGSRSGFLAPRLYRFLIERL